MAKTIEGTLTLEARETGKSAVKKLRKAGMVPAVVYGHGVDPSPVAVDERLLEKEASQHHGPMLNVLLPDGKAVRVFVRELKRDAIKGSIEHVDFQQVAAGETVRSEIDLALDEEAILVKKGLVPSWVQDHVLVEGPPESLPERLHIAAGELAFGDQVTAAELALPAGVRLLGDPEAVVLTVMAPKAEAQPKPEAQPEAAEPDEDQ